MKSGWMKGTLPVALMGVGQTLGGAVTSLERLRTARTYEETPLEALALWEANGTHGAHGGRNMRGAGNDRRSSAGAVLAAEFMERRSGCADRRGMGPAKARVIPLRPKPGLGEGEA